MKRISSGIPGLDKLIGGGFIEGSVNMIAGRTGTGKTIFGVQFLLHGLRNGENGVYLSLEEEKEEIMKDVENFGWDKELEKYVKQGKLIITYLPPTSIKELREVTFNLIRRVNAKRFVLDSLSVATMAWKESTLDIGKLRSEIFGYIKMLKGSGATSLLITEIPETEPKALSRFGFEEFLADGIIILHYLEYAVGESPRSLIIRKMRRTSHGTDIYPFSITKEGIRVIS